MIPIKDDDFTHHKFPKHQRVQLKKDMADVYKMAHAGAVATITERALDEVGDFPMVYVEWDKVNDWRYNGESDMWTFENHFEEITEEKSDMSEEPSIKLSDLAKLFENLAAGRPPDAVVPKEIEAPAAQPEPVHEGPIHISGQEEFVETLSKAMDSASESEAFVVLNIKAVPNQRNPHEKYLVPDVYVQYGNEAAAYALQLATASLSEAFHQEAIQYIVQNKKNES